MTVSLVLETSFGLTSWSSLGLVTSLGLGLGLGLGLVLLV